MAKLSITKFAPSDYQVFFAYEGVELTLGAHSRTQARFTAEDNQPELVIRGENLKYEDGHLSSGTVTSIIAYDAVGHVMATLKDVHFSLKNIDGLEGPNVASLFPVAMKGADRITGSSDADFLFGFGGKDKLSGAAGNDYLSGDGGNDIYTGGSGSDVFAVGAYAAHDVITDFDAMGGMGKQDFLQNAGGTYNLKSLNHGKDTLVQFEDGDFEGSVLLRHVKIGQIDDSDFQVF